MILTPFPVSCPGYGGHSRPTITSRVAQGSEPRKLDRYELFSRQWGEVTGQLSTVTQRGREELAMERGELVGGRRFRMGVLRAGSPSGAMGAASTCLQSTVYGTAKKNDGDFAK